MYFRCPDCLASTWLDAAQPDEVGTEAICADCSRKHALNVSAELGRTVRDHYRNLVDFANENDLDMASAYSVLLGIMSPDQAQVLRRSRLPEAKAIRPEERVPTPAEGRRPEPVSPPDESGFRLMADLGPEFREAIAEGRMTLQEALKRGDREAFASNLVRRHGLRWTVALQVADNRISLREALQEEGEAREEQVRVPPKSGVSLLHAAILLAILVPTISILTWRAQTIKDPGPHAQVVVEPRGKMSKKPSRAPTTASQALKAATAVRTDDAGRVLEVVGPDPTTVLVRYCEAQPSYPRLEPLEITDAVPAARDRRLGLFRDYTSEHPMNAIPIRRDFRTDRWVIGGGDDPVEPIEAPLLPEGALRISLSKP